MTDSRLLSAGFISEHKNFRTKSTHADEGRTQYINLQAFMTQNIGLKALTVLSREIEF
jgi:hypothetical protein